MNKNAGTSDRTVGQFGTVGTAETFNLRKPPPEGPMKSGRQDRIGKDGAEQRQESGVEIGSGRAKTGPESSQRTGVLQFFGLWCCRMAFVGNLT